MTRAGMPPLRLWVVVVAGALVVRVGIGVAWQSAPVSLPPTQPQLAPVPTSVFERETSLRVSAPALPSPVCKIRALQLDRLMANVVGAHCPMQLADVIDKRNQPRVLGSALVNLTSGVLPSQPKAISLGGTYWVVFLSGREAVGDYFTDIFEAYTGRAVLSLVIYYKSPRSLPTQPV